MNTTGARHTPLVAILGEGVDHTPLLMRLKSRQPGIVVLVFAHVPSVLCRTWSAFAVGRVAFYGA
jgi:hypothetical protein